MGNARGWKALKFKGLLIGLFLAGGASAVQIVTESARVACEEFSLAKELRIFKDPTVLDWDNLVDENPILTSVKGNVKIMRLGPPRASKSITFLSRMFDKAPSRRPAAVADRNVGFKGPLNVVPIKLCGSAGQAYNDTLGFVVSNELRDAQIEEYNEDTLPPSTLNNPIPKLKGVN